MSSIDQNGIHTDSLTTTVSNITASMQTIYGADINVDQNSPDGQMINIFAQVATDIQELAVDVYNSFDIDSAYGTVLDRRVAINGVTRTPGTYTVTNVSVTVSTALNLTGLDALTANPNATVFTVSDATGNQFYLQTSQTIAGAGTYVYAFRAATIGAVSPTLNTITNQVTSILGVTSVNNPTVPTTLGVNEQSDVGLKAKHAAMFKLAATAPADAVRAALLAVTGMTDAFVVENDTGGVVSGVSANSIWCIVNGSAASLDIATAIYNKKAPGCGMTGAISYALTRPQGNSQTIYWDQAVAQNLWIKVSLNPRYTGASWNSSAVATSVASALAYVLGQAATIGDIVSALATIVPQAYGVSMGVSIDGVSYSDSVGTSSLKNYFVTAVARVTVS